MNLSILSQSSSYQPSEIIEKCTEAKDMLERWKQVEESDFRKRAGSGFCSLFSPIMKFEQKLNNPVVILDGNSITNDCLN